MKDKAVENILLLALKTWGHDLQLIVAMEELAELISAISQNHFRKRYEKTNSHDVCSEIADVQLVLDTLKLIYGKEEITNKYYEKLIRLGERTEDEMTRRLNED